MVQYGTNSTRSNMNVLQAAAEAAADAAYQQLTG